MITPLDQEGKRFKITIDSVWGGIGGTIFDNADNQFHHSVGIDPALSISYYNFVKKPSGAITPSSFTKFSTGSYNSDGSKPNWILTNPKDTNFYVYNDNGKVWKYSITYTESALNSGNALSNSAGNGAAYYNNYLYFATNDDIARFGPLNGSPVWDMSYWKTTLGKNALGTATNVGFPNHRLFAFDDFLFICDVVPSGTNAGHGAISFIRTKSGANEGSDDFGSTQNALILPSGFKPIDISNYYNDLVIAAIQTTNNSGLQVKQGGSALFFWDRKDPNGWYKQLPVVDDIVSGLYNLNSQLSVFTGGIASSVKEWLYVPGSLQLQPVTSYPASPVPFQGAIDAVNQRIIYGSGVNVFGRGYPFNSDNPNAFHNIATGNWTTVTALKVQQQDSSGLAPTYIIGTDAGLFYSGSGSAGCRFVTSFFNINKKFAVDKIKISLDSKLTSATYGVTPTIYTDNTNQSLQGISYANNGAIKKRIYKAPEINITGEQFLYLDLLFFGSSNKASVLLPIEIYITTLDDATI